MSFKIVTDTCANLPCEIIKKYNVEVLPFPYRNANREYKSFLAENAGGYKHFYAMLRKKQPITTSCISPLEALTALEPMAQAGKDILYVGISSVLSGTYGAILRAFAGIRCKHPERTLLALDSRSVSLGEGLAVLDACELRECGKDIRSVYKTLVDAGPHTAVIVPEDVSYALRGGRVSSDDGCFVRKVMGYKSFYSFSPTGNPIKTEEVRRPAVIDSLAEQILEKSGPGRVGIAHADFETGALVLRDKLLRTIPEENILLSEMDQIIGAHSGPGTLAVFFRNSPISQ